MRTCPLPMETCDFVESIFQLVIVGLSRLCQFFVDSKEVATNVSSFAVHHHFLLLTTLNSQLCCLALSALLGNGERVAANERNLTAGS